MKRAERVRKKTKGGFFPSVIDKVAFPWYTLLEKRKKDGDFMKGILKNIVSVLLLICLAFSIVGCFGEKSEEEIARNKIERLTGIEIPAKAEIVYHIRQEDQFLPGRRFMYTVFQFESEPTDWLNENAFSKEEREEFEMAFSGGLSTKPNELGEIPEEFLPNFKENYYFLSTENCIDFVYIPKNNMLAVSISAY